MRHITSRQALVGGAIALGALAALRAAAIARERRHKITQGVLRPAQSLWTQVGEWRRHTHVALPVHPSDAPPVVLIHGFGVSSPYLLPTAERLGRYLNVYAPALPGHGKTAPPRKPLDVSELAETLRSGQRIRPRHAAAVAPHDRRCVGRVDAQRDV